MPPTERMPAANGGRFPSSARLHRLALHILDPATCAAATEQPSNAPPALAVGAPRSLSPDDFIMGSPGNWQTEGGIVLNAEERAIETLLAAMRSGIADFVSKQQHHQHHHHHRSRSR